MPRAAVAEPEAVAVEAAEPIFEQLPRDPRLSDRVASTILESILSRRIAPGDGLPSERELADQFGVSRTVIREAVRTLSARGLLEVQTGRGARVAEIDPRTVSDAMRLLLRSRAVPYAKVHEVRSVLEVSAAGLAAERARPEDVARLAGSLERMAAVLDDVDRAAAEDVEFHRLVAMATHNELFLVLHDSIRTALVDVRKEVLARSGSRARRAIVGAHRAIHDAIAAADPKAARAAMRAHLAQVEAKRAKRS
jgi:GntR family transcriptional regulator, transcriptional repressor for pyruvate dehydrogenase complex